MGKRKRSKRGQSAYDYLILATVVIAVIVPFFIFSTGRINSTSESQLAEAIETIKNGIVSINNLGYGAATRVIIQIPKGVSKSTVAGSGLQFILNGELISVRVPASVVGVLPTNPGRHYLNLLNNGTHIVFSECGNKYHRTTRTM